MTAEAIVKINAEMQKHPNDQYREIIGQYIIDRCHDKAVAELVMQDGKTLEGALKAVSDAARKAACNQVAVMTPAQVFQKVDKYFGMTADINAQQKAIAAAGGQSVSVTSGTATGAAKKMSLELADFM